MGIDMIKKRQIILGNTLICTCCNSKKDLSNFRFYKAKNYYRQPCKDCENEYNKNNAAKYYLSLRKRENIEIPQCKKCLKCQVIKSFGEFYKNKCLKDGLSSHCKECNKIYKKEYFLIPVNKEKKRMSDAKYFKTGSGKLSCKKSLQRRRERIRDLPYTLTLDQWYSILHDQDYTCNGCKRVFGNDLKPEKDHIIPVTNGGGYTKDNIQALCKSCNTSKGNKIYGY